MARGRIIYPDFWTDSKVIALTPYARLFYIGTWNFTYCDRGHLPDDAQGLKFKILPADPVDGGEILAEIMASDRIVRVSVGNESFLHIPTFERHQTSSADKRWSSRCPACKLSETLESFGEFSKTPANSPKLIVERRGEERNRGEGTAAPPQSPYCPKHPTGTTTPCGPCRTARIAFEAIKDAEKTKPTPKTSMVRPDECDHPKGFDEHGYCHRCGGRK